jgi:four helix bundle protein
MARQLERAGTAVGALVEEAQGAESRKDFVHKMSITHKEARESHYWIRQVHGTGVVSPERIEALMDEARQLKLILAAIVNSSRKRRDDDVSRSPDDDPDEPNES